MRFSPEPLMRKRRYFPIHVSLEKVKLAGVVKLLPFLLCLTLLSPLSLAAPRVGVHAGYTRLVFDLPKVADISTKVAGGSVTVKLNTTLRADQGPLRATGVTAYAVAGNTVTVTLAPGYSKVKTSVLAASAGQPARLVMDVSANTVTQTAAKSTPAAVSRPAGTKSSARPRVIIDPGHGGIDPGMVSQWVREKDVTLYVGLKVRDILRSHGVDVVMTRSDDRHLSADKARDLDMRSNMATTGTVAAYISIHVNAGGTSAEGIETYYFGQPIGGQSRSLAVFENGGGSVGLNLTRKAANTAQSMLGDILAQTKVSFSRQLANKVQNSLIASTGAVNRGVHTDAFYVIRAPKTAAILTEIGFGSSTREGPLLATQAYRDRIANAIAQAILNFLNLR